MKFKNNELESLGGILFNLPLKGRESRMRTRFINLLNTQLKDVISIERVSLVEEYAQRDTDGEMVRDENDGDIIKLKEETIHEFYHELDTLMSEDLYIDENEANKTMLLSVAEIMLEGDFDVSGEDGIKYDRWCEQFEAVVEKYREG